MHTINTLTTLFDGHVQMNYILSIVVVVVVVDDGTEFKIDFQAREYHQLTRLVNWNVSWIAKLPKWNGFDNHFIAFLLCFWVHKQSTCDSTECCIDTVNCAGIKIVDCVGTKKGENKLIWGWISVNVHLLNFELLLQWSNFSCFIVALGEDFSR